MKKRTKSVTSTQEKKRKKKQPNIRVLDSNSFSYSNLTQVMSSVDIDNPESSQNEHSISDDEGGRIKLEFSDYKK